MFREISKGETAFYIADLSFLRVVEDLATASPPLLELDAAPDDGARSRRERGGLPRGSIAVTAIGRAALDGELDRVARCGIDRWLGGAHLEGRGPTWRWDAESRRVVMQ